MGRASSTQKLSKSSICTSVKNDTYFCCCYRMGEPARGSPSLRCREVSSLLRPTCPWLASSSLAWEGVSFTPQQPVGAPGHGMGAGDGTGHWSSPRRVGLGTARCWQRGALSMISHQGRQLCMPHCLNSMKINPKLNLWPFCIAGHEHPHSMHKNQTPVAGKGGHAQVLFPPWTRRHSLLHGHLEDN